MRNAHNGMPDRCYFRYRGASASQDSVLDYTYKRIQRFYEIPTKMPYKKKKRGAPMTTSVASGLNVVREFDVPAKKIVMEYCQDTSAMESARSEQTTLLDLPKENLLQVSPSEAKLKRASSPIPSFRRELCDYGVMPSGVAEPKGNRIIDCDQFQKMLGSVRCHECQSQVTLIEDSDARAGWCSRLAITCTKLTCPTRKTPDWTTTSKRHGRHSDINRRLVLAMRVIGKGARPAKKMSAVLDLPAPVHHNSWLTHAQKLDDITTDETDLHQSEAALCLKYQCFLDGEVEIPGLERKNVEELSPADEDVLRKTMVDVAVTVDGSWGHRGFAAKDGFVSVISAKTGDVIDSHIMTTKCVKCSKCTFEEDSLDYLRFQDEHFDECPINHSGSAAAMEAAGAVTLWARSVEKHNLRYTTFIGDGDSKSFKEVSEGAPYGDQEIVKKQCVGHVQKRMGTRLRNLVNQYRGKKLDDGKSLSGKGRLTLARIDFFQVLYGKVLRTQETPEKMAKATMAILKHYQEDHTDCPDGVSSFCKFKKEGGQYMPLKDPIPAAVANVVRPTFEALADLSLLEGCVGSITQNRNECLHSVIWKLCPKEQYHSSLEVHFGTNLAVMFYNRGIKAPIVNILGKLDSDVSPLSEKVLSEMDSGRVSDSIVQSKLNAKANRTFLRGKRLNINQSFHREEGTMYKSNFFV